MIHFLKMYSENLAYFGLKFETIRNVSACYVQALITDSIQVIVC